jgi:DNA-binding NarL/FixJ family response regulator
LKAQPFRCVVGDDHPAIVSAVEAFFEDEADLELVGTARDGLEALRLIEELSPDVALLDLRMPGPGGIEIARSLTESGSTTAVILYTGEAERSLLLEALDAGARGFVLKEGPMSDVLRAIRTVGQGGTFVDAALTGELTGRDAAERLRALTDREREILSLLAEGMRNDSVAKALSISPLTVRTHVANAMAKLEADTRTEAVATAIRQSLIE